MKTLNRIIVAAIPAAGFATAVSAAEIKLGDLTIDTAWARPSIGKRGNSAAYMTITNKGGTAVATWRPLLSEITAMADSHKVFDSAQIPGEIIDLMVVNTDTLEANPDFGKALTGAWYEIMATMSADDEAGKAARTFMANASGTDLAGYEAQLDSTRMFYQPAEAVAFVNSPALKDTMQKVAEFSFQHGLLGEGAPDAGFVGIETPAGIYGSDSNVTLRFIPDYMAMAAEGKL